LRKEERIVFAGPMFTREALTTPRRLRHFLIRSGYVATLFVLMYTAGQATFGWQQVRSLGDVAHFGRLIFQLFSLLQLTLVLFFGMLFTAGNIAQEKDRQTLILLLMTDLRRHELVLGKLLASLLLPLVLVATSAPVFCLILMLGGVAPDQVAWSLGVCLAATFVSGAWGGMIAFWREKTFQTLAICVLGLVFFLGAVEGIVAIAGSESAVGNAVGWLNPYRALLVVMNPFETHAGLSYSQVAARSIMALFVLTIGLISVSILRLRVWNPNQASFAPPKTEKEKTTGQTRVRHRTIWVNPILWREICTRAYGRRMVLIKLVYYAIAAFTFWSLWSMETNGSLLLGVVTPAGIGFVGLALLSLLLVNAQGVTSITTEKDTKTLELLLVTDITAREFVFGKLGGVLFNTKELIVIPLALLIWQLSVGGVSLENAIYVTLSFLTLVAFAAMLGLHAGFSFDNSRASIANSLGTMFFLFIGIVIFMILLVEARSSFFLQFQSFLVFILMGSIGLYVSLTHRNPSAALTIAAGGLPFLTFYAITEFLLHGTQGVCFSILMAYGFTTVAMLIPAISEFDTALGRSTLDKG
jgi:ABC-type transport system involved in multi-copper enzyme maturation permease subunit